MRGRSEKAVLMKIDLIRSDEAYLGQSIEWPGTGRVRPTNCSVIAKTDRQAAVYSFMSFMAVVCLVYSS